MYDSSDGLAHCIMWDESEGAREGNEIDSYILKWADHVIPCSPVEKITVWADKCYGQNKNMAIMCFFVVFFVGILNKYPQIKLINQKFLLRGHTHMEADIVYALTEREKKECHDYFNTLGLQQLVHQCYSSYNVYNMELQV